MSKFNGKYFFFVFPSITFGLGSWQVLRRKAKLELIEEANSTFDSNPVLLDEKKVRSGDFKRFQRYTVQGKYEYDKEVKVGLRFLEIPNEQSKVGYHVLTPLKLKDSECSVLINRGWIAREENNIDIQSNAEDTQVTAVRWKPEVGGKWTPPNTEAGWNWADESALKQKLKCTNTEILRCIEQKPECKYPVPFYHNVTESFYNHHDIYITTWYSLTVCLIYAVKVFLKK